MATSYKCNKWWVRHYQLLDIQYQKRAYLSVFEGPLHTICDLLYIFYGQQWVVKELFPHLLLGRLWKRLKGHYSNSRIHIWGTFSSCRRSKLGCFRIQLFWCPRRACILTDSSWVLDQPNYWRLGGWSSSCFRITLHPVTDVLNLILLMCWKMLDPSQARLKIGKLRLIESNLRRLDSYCPLSRWGIFLCNKDPGAAFRLLLPSKGAASIEDGGMQYHVL